MQGSIVILVEESRGQVAPITFELFTLAREIREWCDLKITALILGAEPEKAAREIAEFSGEAVIAVRNPHLVHYNAEIYKNLLAEVLPELNPVFVLIGQTTQGMDFAPGLAVRLKAGCIAGVEAVTQEQGQIFFTRSLFNGKLVSDLAPATPTTVLIARPGAFKSQPGFSNCDGRVEIRSSSMGPEKTRTLGIKKSRQADTGLAEAEVIVAAGRGIGKEENLVLIERLAALFSRSAVAGSRPICDQNWLEYKQQVGLTGATVSPKLYIACGISGAIQHTVGMQGAGFIVAICTDPNAAIFDIADVCIVEDLNSFIPVLIEGYQNR
jgi:electron transfer flavoprotein alpha subunit